MGKAMQLPGTDQMLSSWKVLGVCKLATYMLAEKTCTCSPRDWNDIGSFLKTVSVADQDAVKTTLVKASQLLY
jgi:hypothetical protein